MRITRAISLPIANPAIGSDHVAIRFYTNPTYAAVTPHANDPAQHNFFCTLAALDSISSSADDRAGIRFDIPSAQAAKAQAKVNP